MDINKLFEVNRIFQTSPDSLGNYLYLSIFFALCFLLAIILKFIPKKKVLEIFYNQLSNLLLFIGLTGGFLIFMRWQSVPYIGSRVLLLILAVISLFWLVSILIYRYRTLPRELEKKQQKENFEKYLPIKKSRKK